MEGSVIREGFKEAGVLGRLGPKFSPVQYETRKAKKRRQEMQQTMNLNSENQRNKDPKLTRTIMSSPSKEKR